LIGIYLFLDKSHGREGNGLSRNVPLEALISEPNVRTIVYISHSLPSRTKPPNLPFPLPTFDFIVLATAMYFTSDKDGNIVPPERDTYKFYDMNGKCLPPYPQFKSKFPKEDFRKAITIWPYIDNKNRVSPSIIDEVERILLDLSTGEWPNAEARFQGI
jgi:hypothetical protein